MATHNFHFLLLLLATAALFLHATGADSPTPAPSPPLVGAPKVIKNVKNNTEVQELGRFSVQEYNKQLQHNGTTTGLLSFSKVVAAKSQVVAGIKYFLTISADGGAAKKYDAVVVVVPWRRTKELISFAPSTAH